VKIGSLLLASEMPDSRRRRRRRRRRKVSKLTQ